MQKEEFAKLLDDKRLDLRPGISLKKVKEFEKKLGITFPEEYKNFLSVSNGIVGILGESYLDLWPLEELQSLNEGYCVKEFAPGLFLIGSDGGDEAYAFDMRNPKPPVIRVPFIPMDLKEVILCNNSFLGFLQKLKNDGLE